MYSKKELADALERLLCSKLTEKESDELFCQISKNTLDPDWSDYIFHSTEFVRADETTDVEAVANKILAYRPIRL